MTKTPLESWIARKSELADITRDSLSRYQLAALRDTVNWARQRSAIYARRLRDIGEDGIHTLADISKLPFTTPDDLREDSAGFLCVSQSEVNRVITLRTSATSGEAKRVFFTAEDQEFAIDFFHHSLATFAGPGDRVLIGLPVEPAGGAGALLALAVERIGAVPVPFGSISDPALAVVTALRQQVNCVIGVPADLVAMARCGGPDLHLRSAAVCSDHLSDAIVQALEQTWGCRVFEHYGSTEMGLAGGVDCEAHSGYHMREADLYIEVVDPNSGEPVPAGEPGEVVFTTLTRRGMPLIRYRTGDISRLFRRQCDCGSILHRLERVRARTTDGLPVGDHGRLSMSELDEALFPIPHVMRFTAELTRGALIVTVCETPSVPEGWQCAVYEALLQVPVIASAHRGGVLEIVVVSGDAEIPAGQKRKIQWVD